MNYCDFLARLKFFALLKLKVSSTQKYVIRSYKSDETFFGVFEVF